MINKIAFAVLAIFGFIGAVLVGTALHEYSHASDFNDIAQNPQICALALPNNVTDILNEENGYYRFEFENSVENVEKVNNIEKYTEIKAYSFTFITLLIFILCTAVVASNGFLRFRNNQTSQKIPVEVIHTRPNPIVNYH